MKSKFNSVPLGFILAAIVPVIAILIFHQTTYSKLNMADFYNQIKSMNILTALVSLCVVPNLLLFFIFIWTDRLKSARGVLLATFIWAFIVFGVKFLA